MLTFIIIYLSIGALFGLFFIFSGYTKLDSSAHTASLGARLLWLPAAIALWPILIIKIFTQGQQ